MNGDLNLQRIFKLFVPFKGNYHLKRQCQEAEILRVEASPNATVPDQISTPKDLPVFRYSQNCCSI